MRILINHLTRMHGGHICVAGVDLETGRHVRPVLQQWALPAESLARYGGPFDMAQVIDLGSPRPVPNPPHVEDYVFVPARAKTERTADAHEFWNFLYEQSRHSLQEIFGKDLRSVGRSRLGTDLGKGEASLGCLRPSELPELYLKTYPNSKPQIRMKLSDGTVHADAGVTDLRLCGDDHTTPDAERVRGVAKWIADSRRVILSVGLTRKFRRSDTEPYIHWLQVNNIHLEEDPAWQLG